MPDKELSRPPTAWTRVLRTVGYLAIIVAGTSILLQDPFGPFYRTMGVFCVLGGIPAALGSATGRWGGEYVGLPLLGSAMVTFAVVTYRDAWPSAGWIAVPSIALLFAYGVLLGARWMDVSAVARAAREYADAHRA